MRPPSKTALFEAARRWDAAAVRAVLAVAPALVRATDPKGRMALHMACAVKPGGDQLGEVSGIKTVTAMLDGGAGLETAVPMDEDEEDFRATPLWYAVSRGEKVVSLPLASSPAPFVIGAPDCSEMATGWDGEIEILQSLF